MNRAQKVLVGTAMLLVSAALLIGCGEQNPSGPTPIPITITITNTQNQTTGGGPNPSPSPGTGGPSDVKALAIFVFGYDCAAGTPEPSHGDGVITHPCTAAHLTATPKSAAGDAVNHGDNITWSIAASPSNVAEVEPDPNNVLFNRIVRVKTPRVSGAVTLTARLIAPDGTAFEASKTILIVP